MTEHQATAPGQERMRSIKQAWSAEHAARMEKQGFTKDGKRVPDPHPEDVTAWHLNPDSRSTPMIPILKRLWAAPYQMLHRQVLLIPVTEVDTTGTSPGRYPCADCGQQARYTVIEDALQPSVNGWQWCGTCEVG